MATGARHRSRGPTPEYRPGQGGAPEPGVTRPGGSTVDMIVPGGIDDPRRPSGGNRYDLRVCQELRALGWSVGLRGIPGSWPHPDRAARQALHGALVASPPGAAGSTPALVDGLIASGAGDLVAAAARHRPVVVLVHMPFGPADPRLAAAERAMLSEVAAIVTTSRWTKRFLTGDYGLSADRIQVASPGVDRAPVALGSPGGARLLCVAAVTRAKGYDVLLAALAQLATARPGAEPTEPGILGSAVPHGAPVAPPDIDWRCTCVGSLDVDPGFAARLRRGIEAAGLAGRMRLTGPLSGAALEAAYARADLLVVPSRVETWGMVVGEALASGIPVLASDAGGIPEALGHAPDGSRPGMLVTAGDAPALAGAVARWLRDPALRGRLRDAAAARRRWLDGWPRTATAVASALTAVRSTSAAASAPGSAEGTGGR